MRRLTAAVAALGLAAAGLTMAVVAPANAAITAPAAGTIVGSFTFSDSGGANTAGTIPLVGGFYCTNDSLGGTKFEILSGSTVVFSQQIQGTGPKSVNIDSATLANGTYTLRGTDINITSTFLGIGCKGSNQTPTTRVITIANVLQVQGLQSGLATSGPQNTLVPVKATVVDPNAAVGPKAGVPVTFSLSGSAATVTIPTDANGVAAGNLAVNGPPGSRTLTASTQNLFGVPKYPTATASTPFEITKNASITTVAPPAPVVHGQATSFSATVVAGNGTGTPTGTVQFKVDGTDLGSPVNLSGGTANSSSTSGLSTGSHAITAVYSGDGGFEGSTSAAKTQVVGKADTTTTLTDAPSPTVSGQATTFTAHVTVVPPGVGTLAGGVQFNIDGNPFGTAVPLGAGDDATLTVSNLSTGNHDVVAVYNGNADFATSSSAHLTHGVNRADTTLVLSSSSNPAFSGAPITYTAAVAPVSPGAGNPTGDVQFAVDGVNLGAPVPLSGGTATSPVSTQQVGNHTITADYVGDLNFAGQSDTLVQHVVAAQTTTSISVSPNPSVHGQAVNIHVEVIPNAPATGHPTGTIRFVVDGATYDFVDMVNGAADLSISSLTTGAHTIKAVYLSDDLNFFTSTSETVNQQVNKASTKTTVTSSSPTAVFGQPITFTATVAVLAPGAGTPAGTIVFKDGATVIGTQPVSSSTGEQASVTVSNLSVGQHAVSATYSGDDDFNGSNGSASQTVTRAQTTTVLVSSANPAQSGQGIQYTATVAPVAPGAGNPTGTVRFFVNGANIGGPVTVVDGQATSANFASLTPGIYKISATYSGDGNFVGSSGLLDQGTGQNVTKGASSLVVTSSPSPSPSVYGAAVTVHTVVSAVAPAVRKPSGVVQIWEGDELLGATSLAPAAPANASETDFVTTSLSAGTHSLRAVYVGNFNFTGTTGTASQVVGQVPTVTGLTSSGTPAVYGDTVTYTATVSSVTGSPTGSVTFKEGSTVLGSVPLATSGGSRQASLAVAGQHAGTHNVTAVYSGDVSFATSSSAAFAQSITKAPTTIVAADVNNPGPLAPKNGFIRAKLVDRYGNPMAGRSIAFDAPPGAARPARHLCDAVTNAQGIAECDTQVVSIDIGLDLGNEALLDIHGTYDVTYSGDADTIGDTARGHEY